MVIVYQALMQFFFQVNSRVFLAVMPPEDIVKMAILPRIAREKPHASPAGLHLALARVAHQHPE